MISLAIAAAVTAGAQSASIVPRYMVTQSGGGLGYWVEEQVVMAGVYSYQQTRKEPRFWVVEQRRADRDIGKYAPGGKVVDLPGWTIKHQWVDSRSCAPLRDAIRELQILSSKDSARSEAGSRLGVRQLNVPSIPPSDTPEVSVVAIGKDRRFSKMGDYGGPVSRWWLKAERDVAKCWRATPPMVGSRPVEPLILSPWVIRYPQ